MSQPQEVRVTANPNSSWLNKANQAIRGNNIVPSPDFLIEKSTRGTSIKLHPKHKFIYGGVNYSSSSFDVSESFDKNTIVRVTTTANGAVPGTYIANRNIPSLYYYQAIVTAGIPTSGSDFAIYVRDPAINYIPNPNTVSASAWDVFSSGTGTTWAAYNESASFTAGTIVRVSPLKTYGISFYDTQSGNFPPLCPGTFIVVNDVPAATSGSRPSGNLYYPFYPYWDDSATVTVSGSVKNQIYFREIAPLNPNIAMCAANGAPLSFIGDLWESSSVYAFSLPYP